MKLFTYKIRWTQQIREQIYQDESKYIGEREVTSTVKVVADSEAIATFYLHNFVPGFLKGELLSIETIFLVINHQSFFGPLIPDKE